jgi:hypothetical protein
MFQRVRDSDLTDSKKLHIGDTCERQHFVWNVIKSCVWIDLINFDEFKAQVERVIHYSYIHSTLRDF